MVRNTHQLTSKTTTETSPLTLAEPYHELLKASVQELILKVGEEQGMLEC